MKFVGTIIDKSYFDMYFRDKNGKLYAYKICAWCGEEAEKGFGKLDHSDFTIAPNHHCDRGKHLFCAAKSPSQLDRDGFLFIEPVALK